MMKRDEIDATAVLNFLSPIKCAMHDISFIKWEIKYIDFDYKPTTRLHYKLFGYCLKIEHIIQNTTFHIWKMYLWIMRLSY